MSAEQLIDPVQLVQRMVHREITIATAESLTAGALASRIAEVPGASSVLLGGVVSYSIQVKQSLLVVDPELLAARGAVDGEVAAQMALGAAKACGAEIGISTTGVAGPEPHQGKSVGTVYVGIAAVGGVVGRCDLRVPEDCQAHQGGSAGTGLAGYRLLDLAGGRAAIRAASVESALQLVSDLLDTEGQALPGASGAAQ